MSIEGVVFSILGILIVAAIWFLFWPSPPPGVHDTAEKIIYPDAVAGYESTQEFFCLTCRSRYRDLATLRDHPSCPPPAFLSK